MQTTSSIKQYRSQEKQKAISKLAELIREKLVLARIKATKPDATGMKYENLCAAYEVIISETADELEIMGKN